MPSPGPAILRRSLIPDFASGISNTSMLVASSQVVFWLHHLTLSLDVEGLPRRQQEILILVWYGFVSYKTRFLTHTLVSPPYNLDPHVSCDFPPRLYSISISSSSFLTYVIYHNRTFASFMSSYKYHRFLDNQGRSESVFLSRTACL
jgi:hypothetical protein